MQNDLLAYSGYVLVKIQAWLQTKHSFECLPLAIKLLTCNMQIKYASYEFIVECTWIIKMILLLILALD